MTPELRQALDDFEKEAERLVANDAATVAASVRSLTDLSTRLRMSSDIASKEIVIDEAQRAQRDAVRAWLTKHSFALSAHGEDATKATLELEAIAKAES